MKCQLTNMQEVIAKNSWLDELLQFRIGLLWTTKKSLHFLKNRVSRGIILSEKGIPQSAARVHFVPGDIVTVRSEEEIRSHLDDWGGHKGCIFTPEMYERCGKRYRVLRRVEYFYDEVKQKMCKCKDIFLLEGAVCSGRRRAFSQPCDRNCFQFWHASWLVKSLESTTDSVAE